MILVRILLLLLSIFTETVWASTIQITPIKIHLHPKHAIETLKITNQDKEPVLIQLDIKKWQQDENCQDIYENTNELLVTPSLFIIQPEQSQIVRLAVMKPEINPASIEKAYRLILREVPQAKKNNEGIHQLNMVLEMLLPVFVGNLETKTEHQHQHHYTGTVMNTPHPHTTVKINNKGTKHFLVTGLTIFDSENKPIFEKDKLFHYVLPGNSKIIQIESNQTLPHNARIVLKTNS